MSQREDALSYRRYRTSKRQDDDFGYFVEELGEEEEENREKGRYIYWPNNKMMDKRLFSRCLFSFYLVSQTLRYRAWICSLPIPLYQSPPLLKPDCLSKLKESWTG